MAFAVMGTPGSNLVPVAQAQASGTVVGGTFLPGIARAVQVAPPTATPGIDGLDGLAAIGTGPLGTATAADVPTPSPGAPLTTVTAVPALVVPPSAPTGTGIPATVLAAYKAAESSLAASDPACHLPWTLVAGIGRVESGNASGGRVDAAGTTRGRILGPLLDGGLGGTAVVRDTDGGSMDGNAQFDRAVGPMQFLPGTWKTYAQDGNHDGVADPHNIFDAALATGTYLCAGGSDLSQPIPERAALMRYNHSVAYGDLVLRWAAAYAAGVSALPDSAGEVPSAAPTPPEQVPAPAAGSSSSLALAAVSSGDSDSTASSESDTTTTSTPTSTSSTSTSSSAAKESTSTSPSTTTPPTSTSEVSTTPTAPSTTPEPPPPASSSTEPTTPSTVTTTPPSSTTTRTSTPTTTPPRATSSSAPDPEPSGSDSSKSDTSSESSKTDTSKTDTAKASATKTSAPKTSSPETSDAKTTAATPTTTKKKAAAKTTAPKSTATKTTAAKADSDSSDDDS